jgi:hypothetical protein
VAAWSQTPSTQSRIVDRVDESALTILRGNTNPLAQPQYDQGAAPPDLPMARMLLVLKRSDAQETALEALLDAQQDPNSLSYHQWLTPDAFGQQFGPSDQDVQAVAAWLASHGFQIGGISRGRTIIEFSGTAAQVQQAFHTEIHKFVVNGEAHWANASEPQIPQALAPVITGINSLHNFPKQPMYRLAGKPSNGLSARQAKTSGSEFTINDVSLCGGSGNCYFVGPYDFATIYNVLPLWTAGIDGTGQSIAILNESNIAIQDVRDFRTLFGLPANDPQVILNGPDPGLVAGVETEADLDVEWSGAVAKAATIKLVVSASTTATGGVDLSALYAVENNIAPIISESFGQCELFVGTAGNAFQNSVRQQAAAQGITFINSSGDEGSARCDPSRGTPPEPATHGLAVSGLASSPNGVAVGGTDFLNFGSTYNLNAPSPYWNSTNDPQHQASALGYVPETTWNDTCTNNVFIFLKAGANEEASCNNANLVKGVETIGGGGGKSSCITSDGATPSSCSGGYAKPPWQVAPGVPADGARDIPDVSLFASSGFMDSSYIICESDQLPFPQTCSLNSFSNTFLGIGGTSASAPAFAGILALVNQFTGGAGQGNANYILYKMASSSAQTSHACGSTSSPSSSCIFYDVTSGTNAVPCSSGSLNCNVSTASDLYGVLAGYSATIGYDLTTGLGSVNAYNLVHNWIRPTTASTTTLSLNGGTTVNITHGQNVSFSIAVTPSVATGVVSLLGSPTSSGFIPLASFPLVNGSVSGTTAALAGGTSYSVKAHYPGTGTYMPSDSSPVIVTVAPEPSKILITLPIYDPVTHAETNNLPLSIPYGTFLGLRVDVGNSKATISLPQQPTCAPLTCPTGNVLVTDSLNGGTAIPVNGAGNFTLDSGAFSERDGILFSGGSNQISANYSGDNSFDPSSGSYTLTVTPAPTQASSPSLSGSVLSDSQVTFGATIFTNVLNGATPTGTITFFDGTTPIAGTVTLNGHPGNGASPAGISGSITASFSTTGIHQINAQYSGDANYAPVTSASAPIIVQHFTTTAMTTNVTAINFDNSVTLTATATSTFKSPPMTGTFQFLANPGIPGFVTPTLTTDANGIQTLTATVTVTPQSSMSVQALYNGDANYASSFSASQFINVAIPDFTVATAAPSLTITAGQSGSMAVTVNPLSNISSNVALNCNAALIAGASCTLNPVSPLNLNNGAGAFSTFTITTLPPSSTTSTQFVALPRRGFRTIPPPGWWILALADALAILFLYLSPKRANQRLTASLGMVGLLLISLSCGSGSASTSGVILGACVCGGGNGGGGGGSNPVSSTLTLATSAVKVPLGTNLILTATVHSTMPATGSVAILDGGSQITGAQVLNGTATATISILSVGTHVITAQYSGDANNFPSTTMGSLNQVITGTGLLNLSGNTSTITHWTSINVIIQ